MRVLYVAGRFPKLSETFVYNEVAGQLARGHDVRVLSIRPPETVALDSGAELRGRVHAIPRVPLAFGPPPTRAELAVPEERLTRRLYAMAAARWALAGPLSDWRPDVVHAHFANLPALLAAHVARLLGVPYTFMAHAADYMLNMSDDLLARRIAHADRAFVISAAARSEVAQRTGMDDDQARRSMGVVRASVRARPPAEPAEGGAEPRGLRLISVSRLVRIKGIDTALRAFAELRRSRPDAAYTVVGDGPERAALERLAAALELNGSVRFLGSVENERTQELIAGADVAVLPCRRDSDGNADGIPVFMMEAGALGVPVVSTPTSGVPELVEHERGGLLVGADDPPALAAALLRLADDPDLRRRLGDGLRDHVQSEFAIERQLDRLEAAWTELTGAATAGKASVTVVICTRDEEAVIERCVRSAAFADEVLVLDSGSTDRTRELAEGLGARVEHQDWLGFSAQKNRAAALARNDWILSLDADEIVTAELAGAVGRALAGEMDPLDGWGVDRRHDFMGEMLPNSNRPSKRHVVRLYNRRFSEWDEAMAVHETVRVPGQMHGLRGPLLHWNDFTLDELIGLFNRYATLEAAELHGAGRRARPADLLLRPVLRFGWHYVVRGEARLGTRGVVHSGLKATSDFMRYAKLWELGRRR